MSKDHNPSKLNRRALIGTAGGLAAGTALGIAVGAGAQSAPVVEVKAAERYAGKTVLVTGGTSGIGRATVELFAAQGAKVAFCGRRTALGEEIQNAIRDAGGQATFVQADIRREDEVIRFVEQTRQTVGSPDIVIANAGITIQKPLHEYATQEWQDVIDTNLRGSFFTLKHTIPPMLSSGGGTILVISSSVANSASANQSAYVATKSGLVGMVRSTALDYAEKGIRINAILPGTTDTELVRRAAGMENVPDTVWKVGSAQWGKSAVRGVKRMARPEEIAAFIVAMASPDLTFAVGGALSSDGGTGSG